MRITMLALLVFGCGSESSDVQKPQDGAAGGHGVGLYCPDREPQCEEVKSACEGVTDCYPLCRNAHCSMYCSPSFNVIDPTLEAICIAHGGECRYDDGVSDGQIYCKAVQ